MKKALIVIFTMAFTTAVFAQKKDFEGIIVYKVAMQSKTQGISNQTYQRMLGLGDSLPVFIKEGNFVRRSRLLTEYYNKSDEKVYIKVKGIDTLFYIDYTSDTSTLINAGKVNETKTVAGFACNSFIIQTPASTCKFFYDSNLYQNPAYSKNIMLGHYNLFAQATESVWIASYQENENYDLSFTGISVSSMPVPDSVLMLPQLPQKKFVYESFIKNPEFTGSGGWDSYLRKNIKGVLAAKYLKLPKGRHQIQQTAQVRFVVSDKGEVMHVSVLNKQEVHPKLIEEAIRVIQRSTSWQSAVAFGEIISFPMVQPITFMAAD